MLSTLFLLYHCYAYDTHDYIDILPKETIVSRLKETGRCLADISTWTNANMHKLKKGKHGVDYSQPKTQEYEDNRGHPVSGKLEYVMRNRIGKNWGLLFDSCLATEEQVN